MSPSAESEPGFSVALVGWRIVGRGTAAAAYAVAGLPLILHLGGTVMHLGGAGIALRLFTILVPRTSWRGFFSLR